MLSVIVGYYALFYYDNHTDNIQLSFGSSYPTEIQRGSQTEVHVHTTFDSRDQITLRTTGELASCATFIKHIDSGLGYVSRITINGEYNGVNMLIKIPEYIQTGTYEITIVGSNSVGKTSTLVYQFEVTE